jgi:CHAT domain-containing protein
MVSSLNDAQVIEKIWELHDKDFSSRAIEEELKKEGISKSYKTVQRILRKPRPEKPVPPVPSVKKTVPPKEKLPKLEEEKRTEPTTAVILPKFLDIVEFIEAWKQEHQGPYKLKCTVCGEEYHEIVKKCKNNCVAYTKGKKRRKSSLQPYWEEIWPYEKTLIRNPRQWKGLIQSILDITEMIINQRRNA